MSVPAAALPPDNDLSVLDDPVEQRRFIRLTSLPDGRSLADAALRIQGMHCAACAGLIERALCAVDGVLEATVSAAGERARVRFDPRNTRVSAIVRAIRRAGYDACPDAALQAREARRLEHRSALWRLFVAAFCAMQVMMLATPSYVSAAGDLAPDLRQLLNWGSWVLTLPVLAFSAQPFIAGAWRSLRQRSIGMDVPVALGIVVTFVASTGATFDPGGPFGAEVYFDSLTMFVSFLLAGRLLELRARHRVAQTLESAMAAMPQTAWRLGPDGQVEQVSVQRLVPGDCVRVPLGQAFPGDGRVLQGQTQADEALLSGESQPVPKPQGAAVVAGSINLGAPVVVQLDRLGADTRLEAIVAMMHDATSQRPALARTADRWAAPFLWAVLLLAAGAAAVWSVIEPARALWVAVSVLIVTCPCALSLAAPSAVLAAAAALSRRGVMLQRLDALETLTRITRIYLDKTGTLTQDRPRWRSTHVLDEAMGNGAAQLQARAAALAAWSRHPMALALAETRADDIELREGGWHDVQEIAGQGMQARDQTGQLWRLGSAAFVIDHASSAAGTADAAAALWFGPGGRAQLRFEFDEQLRDDAAAAVAALQSRGLEVALLSGDLPHRAQAMARRLGIALAFGGATAEAKLAEIAAAQARGLVVAMVGDGVNDAPVLARADVSFAMGQGALVARSRADAVITSDRLGDLVPALDKARQCMRVVRQNIAWAVLYNAACIPLAMVGWLPPWAAGLGMASSSLLVILNSLRLMR